MTLVADIILTIFLFSLFAIPHSLLASRKLKIKMAQAVGDKMAFYRLFYNVVSVFSLIIIIALSPKPDVIIYDLYFPYDLIIFVFQIIALIGFFLATKPIDMKEFMGINQIIRYTKNDYNDEELDERQEFITEGFYKYSRHPIYFFSILFLLLRSSMDLFYLLFVLSVIVYFITGSYFEEKKLVEIFGEEYVEYQKRVPRIIPKLF